MKQTAGATIAWGKRSIFLEHLSFLTGTSHFSHVSYKASGVAAMREDHKRRTTVDIDHKIIKVM